MSLWTETTQSANKLSAVKCRSGPPFFKQQQQHFSPNNDPKSKYGKHASKLYVKKPSKGKQHSHLLGNHSRQSPLS